MKRKNADNAAIATGAATAVGGAGYAGVKDAGVRFDQAGWDLLNVKAGTKVPPTNDMKTRWAKSAKKKKLGLVAAGVGAGMAGAGFADKQIRKSAFGVEMIVSKAKQQKEFKDYSRKERAAAGGLAGAAIGGSTAAMSTDEYLRDGKLGSKKVTTSFLGRPMETTVPTWEPNTINSPIKRFKHGRKVKAWEQEKAKGMPDSAKPRYEKLKTMAERGSSDGERSAFTEKVKDYENKHGKPFTKPKPVANLTMKAPRTKIGLAGAAVGAGVLGGAYAAPKQNKKR